MRIGTFPGVGWPIVALILFGPNRVKVWDSGAAVSRCDTCLVGTPV